MKKRIECLRRISSESLTLRDDFVDLRILVEASTGELGLPAASFQSSCRFPSLSLGLVDIEITGS